MVDAESASDAVPDEAPRDRSTVTPGGGQKHESRCEECTCHVVADPAEEQLSFVQMLRNCRWCCWLLCCPPIPSSIAAKIAFTPPTPTYTLTKLEKEKGSKKNRDKAPQREPCELKIIDSELQQMGDGKLQGFDCFIIRSKRGNRIAGAYIKCVANPRFIILYSHGNAVDLGIMSSFYCDIGVTLECDVVAYDYSDLVVDTPKSSTVRTMPGTGYGGSTGKASEANLYADIEAVWNYITKVLNIAPSRIILYGQSIGTVPTCFFAAKVTCGGVVLQAPLASGLRMVGGAACYNDQQKTYCCDVFPNINNATRILSPVLVIHGTHDEIIPVSHGRTLHEQCPFPVEPLWVNGAGHNGLELYPSVFRRLKRFINYELPTLASQQGWSSEHVTSPDRAGRGTAGSPAQRLLASSVVTTVSAARHSQRSGDSAVIPTSTATSSGKSSSADAPPPGTDNPPIINKVSAPSPDNRHTLESDDRRDVDNIMLVVDDKEDSPSASQGPWERVSDLSSHGTTPVTESASLFTEDHRKAERDRRYYLHCASASERVRETVDDTPNPSSKATSALPPTSESPLPSTATTDQPTVTAAEDLAAAASIGTSSSLSHEDVENGFVADEVDEQVRISDSVI